MPRGDGSDLENQLDRDILACQNEDGMGAVAGDDPDLMAWRKANNVQGDPTRRFVVPDLPGFAFQGVSTGT